MQMGLLRPKNRAGDGNRRLRPAKQLDSLTCVRGSSQRDFGRPAAASMVVDAVRIDIYTGSSAPLRFLKPLLILERVMGIEPTSKAWEAFILPLNYTR